MCSNYTLRSYSHGSSKCSCKPAIVYWFNMASAVVGDAAGTPSDELMPHGVHKDVHPKHALEYMSGFGNEHQSEALPGALPVGQNSPQIVSDCGAAHRSCGCITPYGNSCEATLIRTLHSDVHAVPIRLVCGAIDRNSVHCPSRTESAKVCSFDQSRKELHQRNAHASWSRIVRFDVYGTMALQLAVSYPSSRDA
jgi:hypothetical protein